MKFNSQTILIIYLAALAAVASFSTDIYLSSMPTIQNDFHTSAANIQLTLSLFFVVLALGQLFWGPLSDRIGRKKIIFVGIVVYIVGSLICALSEHVTVLIIGRIIQALGGCAGIVMSMTVAKDKFVNDHELSKVLSIMMSVMILAPILAPIIGSYLLVHSGWPANFYFLASYGVVLLVATLFVQESHPADVRKPLALKKLLGAYWEQMRLQPFLFASMAVGFNFSMMFSFIAASPFIYINIYHLPRQWFGYFFALNAVALILGGQTLKRLKGQFSDRNIIFTSLLISCLGSVLMFITLYLFPHSIWSVAIPSFILTYGVGLLVPEATAQALKHVLMYKGLAAALVGSLRFIVAAMVGFFMGLVISNSAWPLATTMFSLNILTVLCMVFYFRKNANHSSQ